MVSTSHHVLPTINVTYEAQTSLSTLPPPEKHQAVPRPTYKLNLSCMSWVLGTSSRQDMPGPEHLTYRRDVSPFDVEE